MSAPVHVRIDSHAHVFARDLPLVPDRRYTPERDAPLAAYLDLLDRHGITHGVLTAPSFLGTDNSYLLEALRRAPARLRGTVIVDPATSAGVLEEMDRLGVVGIRLNLYGRERLPDLRSPAYRALLGRVAGLDWHVEIYAEGPRLAALLPQILETGARAVVDHFGSPDPRHGVDCAGFRAVLRAVEAGRTWVKLSAPYRLGGADPARYAAALLEAGGPERLVWGSDWPWTQHDAGLSYGQTVEWLAAWVPDEAQRRRIQGETACRLFGFDRRRWSLPRARLDPSSG